MTENNSGTFRKDIRKNNSVDGKKKANILPKRNIIVHKTNTQKDNRSNYTSANPTYREKINQTIKSKSKNPNRNFQHLNISAELPQKKAYKQKGSSNSMQTRNIEDNYNTFNTNNKNYISCNNSKNNINNCINSTKIQNSNDIDKKKTIQKEEELTKLSHNFVKKISTSSILAPPKKTEEDDKNYIDILNDLKSIFGENLENFDICYLLGELDEGSTKGLIKGLVMQAYHQEKELKKVKEELEYLKNKKSPKEEQENYKKELLKEIESKDEKIEFLTLRIQKMNLILKEVTLDNENLLKKINN